MAYFRAPAPLAAAAGDLSAESVRTLLADVLAPAHFFRRAPGLLACDHVPHETVAWEVFHGRLLDATQTRERQGFESWHLFQVLDGQRAEAPVISLRLDPARGVVHVTRRIHAYVWEPYDSGDNVILSREVARWVEELVGSINLGEFRDSAELRDELVCRVFQAVVGTSRLPLTSVEAPLPEFSLGQLAYCYRPDLAAGRGPPRSWPELAEVAPGPDLAWSETVKLTEALLRGTPAGELAAAAVQFARRWQEVGRGEKELAALLRGLFDEAALSPYTDFVGNALEFVRLLETGGWLSAAGHVDFLSYLLRQLGRHLTAYDLVTFHHRGANYPDALLADAVLKAYLGLIERRPDLFESAADDPAPLADRKRVRRRALRHGWLLRRRYEGHPVPDAPTSPGENARILPPPHSRVPDEQVLDPSRRRKRLFEDDPLEPHVGLTGGRVLRQSVHDLDHPAELQELGMAVFIDRPLAVGKRPGEPDGTLLLSEEAFSRSVALRQLRSLWDQLGPSTAGSLGQCRDRLEGLPVRGVALGPDRTASRPGAVSLGDAARVAPDFLALRTTRRSAADFLARFDFTVLARRFSVEYLTAGRRLLVIRGETEGVLELYDDRLRRRLVLQVDLTLGYRSRAGIEYPAAGLRVLRVGEEDDVTGQVRERELGGEEALTLPPR
jgi:hypothetical protein